MTICFLIIWKVAARNSDVVHNLNYFYSYYIIKWKQKSLKKKTDSWYTVMCFSISFRFFVILIWSTYAKFLRPHESPNSFYENLSGMDPLWWMMLRTLAATVARKCVLTMTFKPESFTFVLTAYSEFSTKTNFLWEYYDQVPVKCEIVRPFDMRACLLCME